MVTVLAVLGVLAVLFAAAAVAVRDEAPLVPVGREHADLGLPVAGPVAPEDLDRLRFGLALRGYRMSEVDAVLDRLRGELADRDRRLAELRDTLAGAPETSLPRQAAQPPPAGELPAGLPPAATRD